MIKLHHERRGSGPPVLFVSGTGGDLRKKPNVFDGPLAAACDVLAYDQRGQGRSDKPPGPYSMADYADDAAALLDQVGWERASVVGVSFGGMVAQEVALRHPDRVHRLVLCCTSSGGAGSSSYPLHELEDLDEDTRLRRSLALSDVRRDEAWQRENHDQVELLLSFMRDDAAVGADDPELARGRALQLAARREHDTWDRLPSITVPTLVCAGRHDGIAPLANSEAIAARVPGARLQVFEGGHLFLLQDRSAWPAIVAFLTEDQ